MSSWGIGITFLLTIAVLAIPLVGKFFKVLNTMLHESGHALMSLLFSGRVVSISLFTNTAGVAVTQSQSWIGRVFVSIAGYPFSSCIAYLLFTWYLHGKWQWVLYLFIGFCVVNLLLWVRNLYGVIWLIGFLSVLSLFLFVDFTWKSYGILFLIFIVYAESVTTSWTILRLSFRTPKEAGDASNLARATKIPSIVWGTFFFLQSLYFVTLGVRALL